MALVGQIAIYFSFGLLMLAFGLLFLKQQWGKVLVKVLVYAQLAAVLVIVVALYYLIFTNRFDYHYVWHHSARDMPFWFKVSCLWEGQEGSFLLWILWNALLLTFVVSRNNSVYQRALYFFIPVQLFLISMIVGIDFSGSDFTLGSTPFSLLKDTIQSEIYQVNPNFVPTDGTGMNALLQNYWMVIHPPIIFLGFAISTLPFALCLGSILRKETIFTWVKPAIPWMLAAVFFIGMGMIMGAYWAYETLNFGGFWNWDPVENAIYIPWVILLGALHLMIVVVKKQKALGSLIFLTVSGFLLVIYSTFLTRSGILGETSVHSFTDLGLSSQLLVFLLVFVVVCGFLSVRALRFIPKQENSHYANFDFWISVGVLVFCLSAFQILIPTSFPVFNKISALFGVNLRLAPPADQVTYYTSIQLWFAIAFMMLTVIAQWKYWHKSATRNELTELLFLPVLLSTMVVSVVLLMYGVESPVYIAVLIAGVFSGVFNVQLLWKNTTALSKSGGALAHVGLVILVLGILFSQGYKKVLTETTQFQNEMNRAGNVLLVKDKTIQINDYEVRYEKAFFKTSAGSRVDKNTVMPSFTPGVLVAKTNFSVDGRNYKKGDELNVDTENSYYRVNFSSATTGFTIEPRIQYNSKMGVIASPDVDRGLFSDVYTHVSNFPDPKEQVDWSKAQQISLKKGEHLLIGSKVLRLDSVVRLNYDDPSTLALKAHIVLTTVDSSYEMKPVLLRTEESTKVVADEVVDKGIQLVFQGVNPETDEFVFAYLAAPLDWITIKSIRFPLINMVWLGALLMLVGIGLSCVYRLQTKASVIKLKLKIEPIFQPGIRRYLLQIIKS